MTEIITQQPDLGINANEFDALVGYFTNRGDWRAVCSSCMPVMIKFCSMVKRSAPFCASATSAASLRSLPLNTPLGTAA